MKTVILRLTDRQADALRELAEQYLDRGPAWECMQEWDEPYEASDLDALKDAILEASGDQAMARVDLLRRSIEVVDDGEAHDHLGCDEEEWARAVQLLQP